jgi:hypothetical protein
VNGVHLEVGTSATQPELWVITVELGKQHFGEVAKVGVRGLARLIVVECRIRIGRKVRLIVWKLRWDRGDRLDNWGIGRMML